MGGGGDIDTYKVLKKLKLLSITPLPPHPGLYINSQHARDVAPLASVTKYIKGL